MLNLLDEMNMEIQEKIVEIIHSMCYCSETSQLFVRLSLFVYNMKIP